MSAALFVRASTSPACPQRRSPCPTCAVGLCPPQPDLAQVRRRYATPTIRVPCAGPGRHESCVVAFGGGIPPSLVPPKAGEHAMARELQGPTTAPAWTGE